jgi:gliding motility associated protien GldN
MRKLFFSFLSFAFIGFGYSTTVEAQHVLDNIYAKEHMINHRPVPYPSIREADVMSAKRIWRVIDLREKMNLPLYYPTTRMDDRFSLIGLLLHGIQYEGLTAFSAKADDEFKVRIGYEEVLQEMGSTTDTTEVLNPVTNQMEQVTLVKEVRSDEVKQILVKEVWYFDRNYSRLDVRVIGICPIREFANENGEIVKKQAFWIYYPEVRPLLARHEVFNATNDAQRRSFDDIFIKRYFGSYIVKEANVFNNRGIQDYAVGVEAMLESNRIRNEIATLEHDLWEF